MSDAIEIVGLGGVVPAAVSLGVYVVFLRCLPPVAAERYSAAAALAAGFFAGYALLPSWAALHPQRHWQWLPYLGAAAMIVGPIGAAAGAIRLKRWLLNALLAVVTAWLLTPAWSSLEPSRPFWILLLVSYLWWLTSALDALPDRLLGRMFLVHLTLVAAVVAILLAAAVSLKYGQFAGIATAAIAAIAACGASGNLGARPVTARGLIPVFVVLVGGLAFVGCIETQPSRLVMLLAPAAPLALWIFAAGPLARLDGKRAAIAQSIALLVPLGATLVRVLID